jgi:hypothetical protein
MQVIQAEGGFKPDVHVRNQQDDLDQPYARTAALMTIGAGTEKQVRNEAEVLSAMRTGWI